MKGRAGLHNPPATSNGLFAQPQKTTTGPHGRNIAIDDDDEPPPMVKVVEGRAKDGVIDMLTDKVAGLHRQLEKAKALRATLHEQIDNLTSEREETQEEFKMKEEQMQRTIQEQAEELVKTQGLLERAALRAEGAEAAAAPAQEALAEARQSLAAERHKRELAELALGRDRR
eukprot:CAMPEP_0206392334 /NCGR_PEP_ID=MMETSP0294-20121207/19905_1 /ASSEMBLY_ACC=CAM_ASM_000327 /TAXON_ID=39354 /ORGANISM="Heterosigma akashiwo, Strain CCMP2393" /LENGTH=171 /DNA_ID=CAMNT_0053845409 /DNA_START=138 /DNA_END=649 /DNA_ORIENTATION=-